MPCRVGITTNPEQRKRYWESRVIGFRNWQTHGYYLNKDDAQAKEDRLVQHCSVYERHRGACHGRAGGGSPYEIGWTVYSFDYARDPGA